MRNKLGIACIFFGVLLLCASLSLYLHNQREANTAEQESLEVVAQMVAQIPEEPPREVLAERLTPLEFRDPSTFVMTEVKINGYAYIGYLSLPTLELDLPIMSTWDSKRLQIAPCRYHGSVNGEDLVLMAHNYPNHFGRIKELMPGDDVIFTDMDGVTTQYQVIARDVLQPTAVEEMVSGEYDLTLFTCTYGGKSRVTVYCDMKDRDT